MVFFVSLGIVAALVVWAVLVYNRLVSAKTNAEEAWSDIDVQLKRRHDLIPNLVSTVKGYLAHEQGLLTAVTDARTRALGAQGPRAQAEAETTLTGTLKSLFAVAENYPDLKANTNFLELQRELADTENKIQAARRFYNGTVRDLNVAMEQFPGSLVAGPFNFRKREFFELDATAEKEVPKVGF